MGNYASLWIMSDSVKYKDYRKAIIIINEQNWEPESTTEEPIWAQDAHLQNFYFVRCIEDSSNAHLKKIY